MISALVSVQFVVLLVLLLVLLSLASYVTHLYYNLAAPVLAKLVYGDMCLSLFNLAYFAAVKTGEEKPLEGITKHGHILRDYDGHQSNATER